MLIQCVLDKALNPHFRAQPYLYCGALNPLCAGVRLPLFQSGRTAFLYARSALRAFDCAVHKKQPPPLKI
jgi:hypothetical protein